MNILIIKLGAIGDVIRTTSILHGLRQKYRNCKIEWVVKRLSFDVLKNNKLIDGVYVLDNKTIHKLKNKKYGLVISLDDEHEACELATKVSSKKIVGAYLKDKERIYTRNSALWFDMGIISSFGKRKADELKAINKKTHPEIMHKILGLKYRKQESILILNKKDLNFGKKFAKKHDLKKSDIVVGINTGAGGRWEDKKLSVEKTAELIDKLNNKIKNVRLLLFGGPEEVERNRKIKQSVKTNVIDAGCNNSLMKFASLVNLCKVLVTSDSLALHIGIALKKKIVAFFCPTPSAEIELYGRGIKVVPKIGCLACYKPKCDIPPEYDVDEMVKAVKKLV